LQLSFYQGYENSEKITVNEVKDWSDDWKTLFVTCIIGRLNGNGDKVFNDKGIRVRGVCLEWGLHPTNLIREDIKFLRDKLIEDNEKQPKDSRLKISEIHRMYEDLEEKYFDSGSELSWPQVEIYLDNLPIGEIDLEWYFDFELIDKNVSHDTTDNSKGAC
jgi:hypothetical protein